MRTTAILGPRHGRRGRPGRVAGRLLRGGVELVDRVRLSRRDAGVDDRVRSRRWQRHHGPHDGRHPPGGGPLPRGHRDREPRRRQRRAGLGQGLQQRRLRLQHLDDVGLVHHHAAAGRHRLDLRGLHPGRALLPTTTRCSSCPATATSRPGTTGSPTPRRTARSRWAGSASSTSTTSCTRCWPSRRATRSSTCRTTRRARSRPRCSPARSTRWSPTRARSSARSTRATCSRCCSPASEPLPGYEDIPTAESLGFGDLPSMPRGLILPPDAPEEAQEWWIDTMKQVVETDAWQQYLEDNYLVEDVRWGEDFQEYLGQTQARVREDADGAGRAVTAVERERHGAGPTADRRLTTSDRVLPGAAGGASASTPRWPSSWSGRPRPAGSGPASSRGSSGVLGLRADRRSPWSAACDIAASTVGTLAGDDDEMGEGDLGHHPVAVLVLVLGAAAYVFFLTVLGAVVASMAFMAARAVVAQPARPPDQRAAERAAAQSACSCCSRPC